MRRGGQLTEAVRRHPYSVVLFDEVEKAHPDVFNILLQVLDDGRITDSQGRTVDFKNTIIILTSNLGSQYLLDGIDKKGDITAEAKNAVNDLLHHSFRPEFLNRLDEIVFYKPLTKDNITHIIDLLVAELNRRLEDKQLKVALTPAAKQHIIDSAYDPAFGARPLRRFVQHSVETLISRKIIADEVQGRRHPHRGLPGWRADGGKQDRPPPAGGSTPAPGRAVRSLSPARPPARRPASPYRPECPPRPAG